MYSIDYEFQHEGAFRCIDPISDDKITDLLHAHFDFRPAAILRQFRLRRLACDEPTGFYQHLAAYGHFGRDDLSLPWEITDKAEVLQSAGS